jgi:hypothetical protein
MKFLKNENWSWIMGTFSDYLFKSGIAYYTHNMYISAFHCCIVEKFPIIGNVVERYYSSLRKAIENEYVNALKPGEVLTQSVVLLTNSDFDYINIKLFEGEQNTCVFRSLITLDVHMAGRISATKNAHTTKLNKKEDFDCLKLMWFHQKTKTWDDFVFFPHLDDWWNCPYHSLATQVFC